MEIERHADLDFSKKEGVRHMSISKRVKIFSVLSAIITIILYCCILFVELDVTEFDQIVLLWFPALAFLVLTCFLVVFAILTTKVKFNERKIKLSVIIVSLLSIVVFCCLTIFSYNSVYSCYTPNLSIEENSDYIQKFFPYHNITENQDSIDIETSVMLGTKRIIVSSYGDSSTNGMLNYTADYFESISPFMNLKFYLDKGVILPSDLIYVGAFTQQKKIEIDGVKITLFTKGNSTDYGTFIRKGNKAIYAEVDNVYNAEISHEDFAKVIINQFELLEKTADERKLLEIPQD